MTAPGQQERVETVEQALKRIEAGFWRRYEADPELQRKLKGKDRLIMLDLTDGPGYTFHLLDGKMSQIKEERDPAANVVITISKADLFAIFNKELSALNAYMTRRAKVKASFADILFAKSLLGW